MRLTVYDIVGRSVATLVHGDQMAGYQTIEFDASGLPSGIYVYRLQAGNYLQSGKMLLMK